MTLKHKVTCSLMIHSVKICVGHHCVSLVWRSGKAGFTKLYSICRGSLLSDGFLSNQSRQCRNIQKYPSATKIGAYCQGFILVIKDNPPRFDSDGDAPRWSIMESKVWNESRLVLNCVLWDHCTGYWIIVHKHVVSGTGSGHLYSDGWNVLTAIQRYPLRPPPLVQNRAPTNKSYKPQ